MEEEIPMMFNEWLNQLQLRQEIWEFCERTILGLSRSLIEVLNQIIDYLKDIHKQDSFNGNLLNNLRIRRTYVGKRVYGLRLIWKVEFVNNPLLNRIHDPISGIMADVQYFRKIVYDVVMRFPLEVYPSTCLLFFQPIYGFNPQCGYYHNLNHILQLFTSTFFSIK